MAKVRVGVIGAGHWGPNLIRTFLFDPRSEMVAICDRDARRRELISAAYPTVRIVADAGELVQDRAIDALVIATPAVAHYRAWRATLAGRQALAGGKAAVRNLSRIVRTGAPRKAGRARRLMTGHVFLYNLAVHAFEHHRSRRRFGNSYYIHARRTNLGPVRQDVHAGWDLATHDISIILYLKNRSPTHVTASGQEFLKKGVLDVVFATLYFADGTIAHIHASWLDPNKVRQITAVGGTQMVTFDDMNLQEPIRIYNRSVKMTKLEDKVVDSFVDFRVEAVHGDIVVPNVSTGEPLKNECQAFLSAISTNTAGLGRTIRRRRGAGDGGDRSFDDARFAACRHRRRGQPHGHSPANNR